MRDSILRGSIKLTAVTAGVFCVGVGCSSAPSGEAIGSSGEAFTATANEKTAYEFFVAQGLKPYQSAAIVGNLMQESNVTPDDPQENCSTCGQGIAQWSYGARWNVTPGDNVVAYANEHNESPFSLNLQLEFLWWELNHLYPGTLSEIRDASASGGQTAVANATIAFQNGYEVCNLNPALDHGETCDQSTRITYATEILGELGAGGDQGTPSPTCKAGATAVARAEQWVSAAVPYCQSPHGVYDGDGSCHSQPWESHSGGVCDRPSNPAWNDYRSDCSGLVSYSWNLGAPGLVTYDGFAPYPSSISHMIPAETLAPGDAVNNYDHIMLFKQWVQAGSKATFVQEPGCDEYPFPPHATDSTCDVRTSGTTIYIDACDVGGFGGTAFTAIRYNGNDCVGSGGGGSTGGGGGGGTSCYSETLGRTVADNTCVQSKYDGCNLSEINSTCFWYQCDNGSWTPRYSDPTACAAQYPVGYTGTGSSGGTGCNSETLRREVSDNACVQSDMNSEWYQCANGNWVDRWTDPDSCNGVYPLAAGRGNGGAGCHSDTLGRTMPDNACVESSSNDDWYQCDNGSWTDRWTDPTACNGVYPLR